ncbi:MULTISPECIES: methylated-DNA--[protein]-cysteine S-methyltransferase [unclassified Vibrio]|uniref:methylated-DNA--[protein]-cysteine S-methyltransferase n=1 Tax=unclassified Vibrio TaxID=2614977 RepID=UPI001483B93B|nr:MULTISPECIES: methylated-DNA--[protein]-cysteine S-methyltransferase [unclassified Vibrio]NNN44787.1 methylated-DNA--[protein]-cysteine S-methyltransferase [Vibrio sp. 1-1(7)]NNN72160.1 methylated-DNA--[protein]-cysteine S-methyltransferase [Vibrio sp. 12-2(3-a)]
MYQFTDYQSPLGKIILQSDPNGLSGLWFITTVGMPIELGAYTKSCPILIQTINQLSEYFLGRRTDFDLPLSLQGSEFQQKIWQVLRGIPYGKTWSYGQLAQAINQPTATRAVGVASSRNPISIIIPCHRVIGKNGALTGYAGGIERKAYLLELEKKYTE